jgi:hypothetical protein
MNEQTKPTRRIRYRFSVDQAALWNAGVRGIDFSDIAIYEFVCGMMANQKSDKKVLGNRVFVRVCTTTIIEQLPYLSRKHSLSKDAIFDRITNLVEVGLLDRHPDNQRTCSTFYATTELGDMATETVVVDDSKHDESIGENSHRPWEKTPIDLGRKLPSTLGENSHRPTNIDITIQNEPLGKETCAQEEKITTPKPPKQKSTMDIPECEGHGVKIELHEYPQQAKGIPFIHPDLIQRIDSMTRLELWWKLYGLDVGKMKCEIELLNESLLTDDNFAKLYKHTFLYVAVTAKGYRCEPLRYLKGRKWLDEIIDRREKSKEDAKPAARTAIDLQNEEVAFLKEMDRKEAERRQREGIK